MTGFLIIIHTIISVLLITVVLMQASQGGGLSGTFGGNAASSIPDLTNYTIKSSETASIYQMHSAF